jgi:hypothetical protein
MSKVLNVENGNYIVKVEPGQHIILDTSRAQVDTNGELLGKVIINGQLDVKGTTTSIQSADLVIEDNIIVLNKYQDGTGISTVLDGISGIEIDRGQNGSRARMVWDESITWDIGGDSGQGTWTFRDVGYGEVPIYVGGIKSPGTLYIDVGNEVISVENSVDYTSKVWNYVNGVIEDNGNLGLVDDNVITNARSVADYVQFAFNTLGTGNKLEMYDTNIIAYDFDYDGDPSRIEMKVDDVLKVTIDNDKVELPELVLENTTIRPKSPAADLNIRATGGNIILDKVVHITETANGNEPVAPTEGVKIYSKEQGEGDTGIYYLTPQLSQDELISRNRSLVYSMLF